MADLNAHRCIFTPRNEFVVLGDPLACAAHRAEMDAMAMPWDQAEGEE